MVAEDELRRMAGLADAHVAHARFESALAWVRRAQDIRAGRASDFRGC